MRKVRPLFMGKDGAGKSWFANTFPKPLLVLLFDAADKAEEYMMNPDRTRRDVREIQQGKYCYYQDVFSSKDPEKFLVRIEYWGEVNPTLPTSYGRFIGRLNTLEREVAETPYATVVLDSVTAFELAARYYSEYNVNKTNSKGEDTREGRLHYAFSMKACEQMVMTRMPNLLGAFSIVIAHYDEEQVDSDDGEKIITVRTIAVPGKLARRIGTQFSEVWRVYVDEKGEHVLQTCARPRNTFNCKTSIGVPDYSYPHFESVKSCLLSNEDNAKYLSGKRVKEVLDGKSDEREGAGEGSGKAEGNNSGDGGTRGESVSGGV